MGSWSDDRSWIKERGNCFTWKHDTFALQSSNVKVVQHSKSRGRDGLRHNALGRAQVCIWLARLGYG